MGPKNYAAIILSALLLTGLTPGAAVLAEAEADAAPVEQDKTVPSFALPPASALPLQRWTTNAAKVTAAAKNKPADTEELTVSPTDTTATAGSPPAQTALSAAGAGQTQAQPVAPTLPPRSTAADILQRAARSGVTKEIKLPNGLRVLLLEAPEFPVVSCLVWYKVGSRDEEPGHTGLSHLTEHLLFGNVGSFKAGDIGATIARVGGQFNGYTSDDFITFFETLPSSKLELALKIESERMRSARFSESEVQQEIKNIYAEFENESKDPVALVSKETRALLFMQHPYHNPTMGWKSDLENLHAEDVKGFYDRYFWPDNATLIIAGDFETNNATALVEKYFAAISKAPSPVTHLAVSESSQSERRVFLKYPGRSEVLQVAYRAPALGDGDAAAMVILEKALNGGLSGKLRARLVGTKLCLSSSAAYEIKKEPGLFTITATAVPATLGAQQRIQEAVDGVVAQLKEKPLSDSELRRAKNQAEYAFFSECDGPYRAGFHLGYFDSLNQWQSANSWADRLRAVTAADVMRVARRYLSPDARVIGWIAGTAAPKPAPPKPPEQDKKETHEKGTTKTVEHARLTGRKHFEPGRLGGEIEHVRLAAFKEKDASPAPEAAKQKEKEKRASVPAIITKFPQAIGKSVQGDIPGAVGDVGSAILNAPGALVGDLSQAVVTTAGNIGKQISQLIPGNDTSSARVSRRVLKNGITLLVFESHISPVVQINGSLEAGDAYNPANKPGLSQVAAALLNQGSATRSKSQITAMQDDRGIPSFHMLRFENQPESIDFQARCLSRDLNGQLELLAECLSSPSSDEAVIEKAKQEAVSSVRKDVEDLSSRVDRLVLQSVLAENSPFCPADPADKVKAISTTGAGDLQKFFAAHVVPSAATIVLAGDVDVDRAAAMAERAFARWNGKNAHGRMHAHASPKQILRTSLPLKDAKSSTICFGRLIPLSESHQDFGSLMIADGILVNHPMVSRFERAICTNPLLEKGLSESAVCAELIPFSNQTRWSLSFVVKPEAVQETVKAVKSELRQLAKTGVQLDEFNEVRRYLSGSIAVKEQSTLSCVGLSICEAAEHGDVADAYNMRLAGIRAATVESVNKVIRTTFKPELSTLVVAGPGAAIKQVRTASTPLSDNKQ